MDPFIFMYTVYRERHTRREGIEREREEQHTVGCFLCESTNAMCWIWACRSPATRCCHCRWSPASGLCLWVPLRYRLNTLSGSTSPTLHSPAAPKNKCPIIISSLLPPKCTCELLLIYSRIWLLAAKCGLSWWIPFGGRIVFINEKISI